MAPPIRPPVDRFAEKVALTESGCLVWLAGVTGDGYGRFRPGGRQTQTTLAHRWSYEHHVGPIPKGLHLDHLCRNPPCVNPDHLEPVTCRENSLRGTGFVAVNAAKTHCPAGHPYSGENLYTYGWSRACRTCRREARQRSARKAA